MAKNNNAWDTAFKSIQKQITDWGEIQANRQKIMSQIAVNEIQAKNNAFYKMQEKQMLNPLEQEQLNYQRGLNQKLQSGEGIDGGIIVPGQKGAEVVKPTYKDAMFNMLNKKKMRLEAEGKKLPEEDQVMFDRLSGGTSKGGLSPMLQKAKDKRTEDLITSLEQGKLQSEMISDALDASKRISGGLYGKLSRGVMKYFDPNNPALADWQKIKMVLTDAQLLNTAKTKGAISDAEMKLFSKAASNDDIASVSAMMPVFNKLMKMVETDNITKISTYKKLYGEDPTEWEGVKQTVTTKDQAVQTPTKSFKHLWE